MVSVSISFLSPRLRQAILLLFLSCVFLNSDVVAAASDDPIASTEIRRVSFATRSDGGGLVIRLHANHPIEAYSEPRLEETQRLEFIVFNAELASSYHTDQPHDPIVDLDVKTRSGHLVFNFSLDDRIEVEAAAYPDHASNDLLIGVTFDQDEQPAVAKPFLADRGEKLPDITRIKTEEEPADPPVRVASAPVEEVNVETLKVTEVSHEMPVIEPVVRDIANDGSKWTLDTVVIDAGHGGHDSGAVANGIEEKDINLSVSLKLGYYLERFLGLNVVFTRTEDEFVELEERGHIANLNGAKLFISIHANSAPYSSAVRGTETYILGLHRSEKALEVMERENSVVRLEENPNRYDDFDQNNIMRTLAFSANMRMSEKLAGLIEHQFAERARRQSRGVKQAGLIVLWAASMPAVLVELGYLTNRFEAGYLNSEEGQDYLASAIFRAVRDFKLEYEKGLESENKRVSVIDTEH